MQYSEIDYQSMESKTLKRLNNSKYSTKVTKEAISFQLKDRLQPELVKKLSRTFNLRIKK
jgi:hypothetical protein